MIDKNLLEINIIFQQLREAYRKWRGQGKAHVVRKELEKHKNEPCFQAALHLFISYLWDDNVHGEHRFRREKRHLFLDAYLVTTTADFKSLAEMVASYQQRVSHFSLEKLTEIIHYGKKNLISILDFFIQDFSLTENDSPDSPKTVNDNTIIKIRSTSNSFSSLFLCSSMIFTTLIDLTTAAQNGKLNYQDSIANHIDAETLGILGLNPTDYIGIWNNLAAINSDLISLKKFIDGRTVIDPNLNATSNKIINKACDNTKKKIFSTLEKLPHSRNYIIPTLRKNGFRVVCTSKEQLDKYSSQHPFLVIGFKHMDAFSPLIKRFV